MANITILVKGYADENSTKASSTVILIQENGKNIIVDPGIDRPKLLGAIYEVDIDFVDINYIIITHYHPDHCALMGLFPNAQIIDADEISDFEGHYQKAPNCIPDTHIKIVKTPGHVTSHCSVIVNDEKFGRVAISGDVIWWWDEEDQQTATQSVVKRVDKYAVNQTEVQKSRQELLGQSDYIIPGHGNIFKVDK